VHLSVGNSTNDIDPCLLHASELVDTWRAATWLGTSCHREVRSLKSGICTPEHAIDTQRNPLFSVACGLQLLLPHRRKIRLRGKAVTRQYYATGEKSRRFAATAAEISMLPCGRQDKERNHHVIYAPKVQVGVRGAESSISKFEYNISHAECLKNAWCLMRTTQRHR
jgi:hypothetical protein